MKNKEGIGINEEVIVIDINNNEFRGRIEKYSVKNGVGYIYLLLEDDDFILPLRLSQMKLLNIVRKEK